MKKFLTTFFILLILAGLGFFFGWAQMGISPGAIGVIVSKSHGVDTSPVRPGEFRWVWYKLIPTNAKTVVLRLAPVSGEISAKNVLPSGRIYSGLVGINTDFSWEIDALFSFSLSPDAVIPLVAANIIGSQEDLARYEAGIAGQIEDLILRRLNFSEEFVSEIEILLNEGASPALEHEIAERFPQITDFSLEVASAKFPDFAMYRTAKGLYEDYIARQREYIAVDLREKARNQMEIYSRLGELELYGALLSKYPILLEYLTLENSKN